MEAIYYDEDGLEVVVSQGIAGPDGEWGVYRKRKSGGLKRVVSNRLIPRADRTEMLAALHEYAKRKVWTRAQVKEATA